MLRRFPKPEESPTAEPLGQGQSPAREGRGRAARQRSQSHPYLKTGLANTTPRVFPARLRRDRVYLCSVSIGLSRAGVGSGEKSEGRRKAGMIRRTFHSLVSTFAEWRPRTGRSPARAETPPERSSLVEVTLVGLVRGDEDRRFLAGLCGRKGWQVIFTDTCRDAKAAIDRLKAPVVLCDRELPELEWRKAVARLAAPPHRACVILLSGAVDTNLWNEVVRGGGYDVLSKPMREDEVVRAVRLAHSYWNSPARTGLLSAESSPSQARAAPE